MVRQFTQHVLAKDIHRSIRHIQDRRDNAAVVNA